MSNRRMEQDRIVQYNRWINEFVQYIGLTEEEENLLRNIALKVAKKPVKLMNLKNAMMGKFLKLKR